MVMHMQKPKEPPKDMWDFIKEIDRRDFIRKGLCLAGGFGASVFFRLGKSFYDEYNMEDLAGLKSYDKLDRREGKKYPSMDVFNAFCNKKNYDKLERALMKHDDILSRMEKIPNERREPNEVIEDCTDIVSGITGFDISKAPDMKEMESKSSDKFYKLLTATGGGVLLSYLTDRYKLAGNKSLPASRLIAFGSGILADETFYEHFLMSVSPLAGYFRHKDKKIAIKDMDEMPLDTMAHELGHLVLYLTGNADKYGASVDEGFCEGVARIATEQYDRKRGTGHNRDSEEKIAGRVYEVYEVASEFSGYPKQKNLVVKYQIPPVLVATKKTLGIHAVGCALFQTVESEEGEALYKRLIQGYDSPLERFIYGQK